MNADTDNIDDWVMPEKGALRRLRKRITFEEFCMVCTRAKSETVLRNCAGWRQVQYCSKECQRANWCERRVGRISDNAYMWTPLSRPAHKSLCSKEYGKGIHRLVQTLTTLPVISVLISACIALELGLRFDMTVEQRQAATRVPLIARVDIGIEPTDIEEMRRLCTELDDWDCEGVVGMLQIHYISSPLRYMTTLGPLRYDTFTQRDTKVWTIQREELDRKGHANFPLVKVEFVNNFKESTDVYMPISPKAFLYANIVPTFARKLPLNLIDPYTGRLSRNLCAEYINNINEHIRADRANTLKLRAPMRQRDKQLIIDACKFMDTGAPRLLRVKICREPAYEKMRHALKNQIRSATAPGEPS